MHLRQRDHHRGVGVSERAGVRCADVDLHLAAARVGAVLRLSDLDLRRACVAAHRALDRRNGGVVLAVADQDKDLRPYRIGGHRPGRSERIADAADGRLVCRHTWKSADQLLHLLRLGVGVRQSRVLGQGDRDRKLRAGRLIEEVDPQERDQRHRSREEQHRYPKCNPAVTRSPPDRRHVRALHPVVWQPPLGLVGSRRWEQVGRQERHHCDRHHERREQRDHDGQSKRPEEAAGDAGQEHDGKENRDCGQR